MVAPRIQNSGAGTVYVPELRLPAPVIPTPEGEEAKQPEAEVARQVAVVQSVLAAIKGTPDRVFNNQQINAISDDAMNTSLYNMLHVLVLVSGTSPVATLTVVSAEGLDVAVPDPNGVKTITTSTAYLVAVPITAIKLKLSGISGSFTAGQGFTVIVTPFVGAGVQAGFYDYRSTAVLHRNAVAAVDKLTPPVAPTLAGVTVAGGSLAFGTSYYVAVVAANRYGETTTTVSGATAPGGANNALRATIAQITNAEYYDLFLSTDTAPKHVLRVTEAQRAAGGQCTVVETYAAGGTPGAIDIGIPGTGIQTSAVQFTSNNAFTPALVTPVSCAGASRAHLLVKLAITDMRSAPSLIIVPFLLSQLSGDYYQGKSQTVSVVGGAGQSLMQDFELDVDGASGLVCLIDAIAGQGAAATIYIETA